MSVETVFEAGSHEPGTVPPVGFEEDRAWQIGDFKTHYPELVNAPDEQIIETAKLLGHIRRPLGNVVMGYADPGWREMQLQQAAQRMGDGDADGAEDPLAD